MPPIGLLLVSVDEKIFTKTMVFMIIPLATVGDQNHCIISKQVHFVLVGPRNVINLVDNIIVKDCSCFLYLLH